VCSERPVTDSAKLFPYIIFSCRCWKWIESKERTVPSDELLQYVYKTAELSQRRPRDAPNIWVPWKVLRVLTSHPATFSEICSRLLFRSILRMCVQKWKFVALPVPEIIGGTEKNLGSPCIRPRFIFSQIFNCFLFARTFWIYLPNLR